MPGLVALYDIRPGNGVGPFLQPRSLHGAASSGQTGQPIGLRACAQGHWVSLEAGYKRTVRNALRRTVFK